VVLEEDGIVIVVSEEGATGNEGEGEEKRE
jgi:hypothetical protein